MISTIIIISILVLCAVLYQFVKDYADYANNIKLLRKIFLIETIFYYLFHKRGISMFGCTYTAGCAIGRVLPMNLRIILDKGDNNGTGVSNRYIFDQLPDKLKKLDKLFLREMQRLHDSHSNWVLGYTMKPSRINILTKYGWREVIRIWKLINTNYYA